MKERKRLHRTNTIRKNNFWTKVLNFARANSIPIEALATLLKEQQDKRRKWNKKGARGNNIRRFMTSLLPKRGSSECFRYELSIKTKTGNMEDVIKAIRKRLDSAGLGGASIVPGIWSIKSATKSIMQLFVAVCEPKRTYSGFRASLLKSVKFVSLVLMGETNLKGLKIDIWGDGCTIGGLR